MHWQLMHWQLMHWQLMHWQLMHWQLVKAGAGIGAMPCEIGDTDPMVPRIAPFRVLVPIPLWIAALAQLLESPRMRLVFAQLVDGLST